MTVLPRGWAASTLVEACELVQDCEHRTPKYSDAGIPALRPRDVVGGTLDLDGAARVSEAEYELQTRRHSPAPGDIVYSRELSLGWAAKAPSDRVCLSQGMVAIRPGEATVADYLVHLLNGPGREHALASQAGSAHPHLNLSDIRATPVLLAPLAEQERIVAAIEEAFSKLGAGEVGLRTVRQLLKRMRDAVLATAVTGRLVPQDPTDTPATKLLADLGVERASEPPEDLPATWTTVRLGDLVSEPLANGKSVRSRPGGFPVLRLTCLKGGGIDLAERKDGDWEARDAASVLVHRGDFFVSRGNGSLNLVGRGGLVVDQPDPVAYPDTLIRVRVPGHVLAPALLVLVWNAPIVREQLEPRARTTAGIYKVNQSMLSDVRLPLPPPEEQQRLVVEVERQMSFLEACERAVAAGLERSAALRRSVLKAAFEGKLVPQDPSDEPASLLLDRIRAERAAAPRTAHRSRRTA